MALAKEAYDEVLQIIRTSNLVGQSIIAYLQKKGYAEIALHFVQDPSTRFDLAIECGNLEVALEMARSVDKVDVWKRLAAQALKQGSHKTVEIALQKTKNLERLSFTYLTTGNTDRLRMMQAIAGKRGDQMARFHNSLYLGDAKERVSVLSQVGMDPLAYWAAKTAGLEDEAQAILEAAGMTEDEVPQLGGALASSSKLAPPQPLNPSFRQDWPIRPIGDSFFARALANGHGSAEQASALTGEASNEGAAELSAWGADNPLAVEDGADEDDDEDGEGWDIDVDIPDAPVDVAEENEVEEAVPEDGMAPGTSESDIWVRNSPLAADHVAAGSFETAMTVRARFPAVPRYVYPTDNFGLRSSSQLLNRQIGATHFEPLKPYFLSAYRSSHVYVQGNPSLDPIQLHVRRNPNATATNEVFPAIAFTLQAAQAQVQDGYNLVKKNKIADALATFKTIIQTAMLVVVQSDSQESDVRSLPLPHWFRPAPD